MSRSRRKTPRTGITKADSEKKDKRFFNRAMRRRVNAQIQEGRWFDLFPKQNEIGSPWDFDKDGKQWFDKDVFPELMRK